MYLAIQLPFTPETGFSNLQFVALAADALAADDIISAIRGDNPGREIEIVDRGAYVRIQGDGRLVLTETSLRRHLGPTFGIRSLGTMLASFAGDISTWNDRVEWVAEPIRRSSGAPSPRTWSAFGDLRRRPWNRIRPPPRTGGSPPTETASPWRWRTGTPSGTRTRWCIGSTSRGSATRRPRLRVCWRSTPRTGLRPN